MLELPGASTAAGHWEGMSLVQKLTWSGLHFLCLLVTVKQLPTFNLSTYEHSKRRKLNFDALLQEVLGEWCRILCLQSLTYFMNIH